MIGQKETNSKFSMEFVIRVSERPTPLNEVAIRHPRQIQALLSNISSYDREAIYIVFLNSRDQVLGTELHTIGTINSCVAYHRELARSVLLKNATSIVLAHNHPSGCLIPSSDDLCLTREIYLMMELIGVELLDHVIVGEKDFYSIAEHHPEVFDSRNPWLREQRREIIKNQGKRRIKNEKRQTKSKR